MAVSSLGCAVGCMWSMTCWRYFLDLSIWSALEIGSRKMAWWSNVTVSDVRTASVS